MRSVALFGTIASLGFVLAGCDGKTSAVTGRDGVTAASFGSTAAGAGLPARDPRDLPTPTFQGKPLWAANRSHTAEENAAYQFTKNGGDFHAKSESDYVGKAHAFIDKPPSDVETVERANGDRLLYDPKANVFVVEARNGAPRTMFKPHGGGAYWTQQKDREAKSAATGGGSEQG